MQIVSRDVQTKVPVCCSIILSAGNDATRLNSYLLSLSKAGFPADYELIVVNDQELANDEIEMHLAELRVMNISGPLSREELFESGAVMATGKYLLFVRELVDFDVWILGESIAELESSGCKASISESKLFVLVERGHYACVGRFEGLFGDGGGSASGEEPVSTEECVGRTILRHSAGRDIELPEHLVRGELLPVVLHLESGNRCNADCMMCDGKEKSLQVAPKWLSVDDLVRRFSGIRYVKQASLAGSYCEPFLNKDMVEIIRFLKGKRAVVEVISNGSVISESMAEKLIEVQLDKVIVSIHGATKATAEAIMGNISFEKVISNIYRLIMLRKAASSDFPRVNMIFVGMKKNISELGDLVILAGQMGVTAVHLKPLMGDHLDSLKHRLKGENLVEYPELLIKEYGRAKSLAQKFGMNFTVNDPYRKIVMGENPESCLECSGAFVEETPPGKARWCLFPFEKPYVSLAGDVSLCCSDAGRGVCMGDVTNGGLAAVWDSDAYVSLRRALLTGENLPAYCDKCERAPVVEPFVMQMDVALRQAQFGVEYGAAFVKENMELYPEYVRAMEAIGQRPVELDSRICES